MKSLTKAGNIKLRGKLSKDLSCKCCTVINFKRLVDEEMALKEIRAAKNNKTKE
jgi:hypothetical protein